MKVAVFSLSSCSGCLVEFLNMEEKILEVLKVAEISAMPIARSNIDEGPYDIVFVEGSPTTEEQVRELIDWRNKTKVLVALGSCATLGGVQTMIEDTTFKEAVKRQYCGEIPIISVPPEPLDHYVEVDYKLHGCPFELSELLELLKCLVNNKKFEEKEYDVCAECILREVNCLLERGLPCMGPVTRGGCNARCPAMGAVCTGCRGEYPHGNVSSHIRKLKELGYSEDEIHKFYNKYGRRMIK